ncbi:hypothetical protein BU23DRAFT_254379 [Bimuria novae-zelandiae CBS 107.79]|uniref:Uncharacterized protein n=1 Tax=Bimuria novae-zelandiae CBS 107.79 TaxID=1447943 RepID=A0A6A5VRE2_9PLEO|nr:hypothetical protein BU23DRAFT_254379 [Bimuria novae-zelandiae CBS 107.79]
MREARDITSIRVIHSTPSVLTLSPHYSIWIFQFPWLPFYLDVLWLRNPVSLEYMESHWIIRCAHLAIFSRLLTHRLEAKAMVRKTPIIPLNANGRTVWASFALFFSSLIRLCFCTEKGFSWRVGQCISSLFFTRSDAYIRAGLFNRVCGSFPRLWSYSCVCSLLLGLLTLNNADTATACF